MIKQQLSLDGASYTICLPDAETDAVQKAIAEQKQPYELEMLRDLSARLQPGDLVLDVAACIGNRALYLASVVGCRVDAIESNPDSRKALAEAVDDSELGTLVSVYPELLDFSRYEQISALVIGDLVEQSCLDVLLRGLSQVGTPFVYVGYDCLHQLPEINQFLAERGYQSRTIGDHEAFFPDAYLRVVEGKDSPFSTPDQKTLDSGDVAVSGASNLQQVKAELSECSLKYRKSAEQLRELVRKHEAANTKYREATGQVAALKSQISELELQLKHRDFECQSLATKYELEKERLLFALEKEKSANSVNDERRAMQQEHADRELTSLRDQLAEARSKLKHAQEELGKRKELLDQANEKYRHVTGHQVPELKEQLAAHASHAAELQQRLEQQDQQHAQIRTRLEADIRSLEELMQSVQKERSELAGHYRDAQKELSARLEEISQLNEHHHLAIHQTIPQLEEALMAGHERIAELKAQLEAKTSQTAELQHRLALMEQAQTTFQQTLDAQSHKLDSANQKYRETTAQIIPQLKQKLEAQTARARELQQRTEQLNRELKQAQQEQANAQRALSAMRSSLTYKAGLYVRTARGSFKDTLKLPLRLWRLGRSAQAEANQSHAALLPPPTATDHAALHTSNLADKPNQQVRMACIMDDFTYGSYAPECELFQLTPEHWQSELEAFQPELLFIESAWRGKDELWGSKVGHCSQELQGIVAWCRERHIPTLFWNKEDPVHFETFLTTAQLFDFVFTTDMDCIHRYKAALGHEHVYFLPFACQPAVHNPIEKYVRKDAFCFAGAYYVRYPERTRDLESFVKELPVYKPLEIYDRNFGKDDPNYQFPAEYQPYIVGTLPFTEIDKAYKGYRFAINLNSIKQSQTMFARRVYELLGSNTLTISNYSRGVRLMFGDLVLTSDSGTEIRRRLEQMEGGTQIDRLRLAGLRKVMGEHTYADRVNYILEKITGQPKQRQLPAFVAIAAASNVSEAEAIIANVVRQQGVNVELILVCGRRLAISEAQTLLEGRSLRGQAVSYKTVRKQKLLELAGSQRWVAGISAADYYGPHYLLDMALATRYSNAHVIGKAAFYLLSNEQAMPAGSGQAYQSGQALAARRSVIHPELAQNLVIKEWLRKLDEWIYQVPDQLSIDPYNYCQDAGATPGNPVTDMVDDVSADAGVPLAELTSMAESIAPLQSDLEHAPWLDGAQFSHLLTGQPFHWLNSHGLADSKDEERSLKLTRNEAISARLMGPLLEIDSQLPDGKHEYLYASKDITLLSLQQQAGGTAEIPLHLQIDPGLNLSLVVLYLDKDKQRLGHVVLQPNRNNSFSPPEGTEHLRFGLRVYAGGSSKIHRLVLGHLDLEPANILGQSDVLLLTNHYPSYDDLYRNGFVHSRVKAYRERNVNVDIFRLRKDQPISWHEFQDVDVTTGSQQALRRLLASGRYRHVLVHFLDPDMWDVLKDFIDGLKVTVWVHGAEVQPWWRREYNYQDDTGLAKAKLESDKRVEFWRTLFKNLPKNLSFVFVSQYFANEVFEDIGVKLPESCYKVIHNPIDTELFSYEEKSADMRFKVLTIRPFASRVYANDLLVKAIEVLSKEDFFDRMEFKIVGDGVLFDETIAPLCGVRNVSIHKGFIDQQEIARLHKQFGIFLCPSRYDTQGVSRDEARSSGLVPITNDVGAISEFVSQSSAELAASEDYEGLAAGIKRLVLDSDLFLEKSMLSAREVRGKVCKKVVLESELMLIAEG